MSFEAGDLYYEVDGVGFYFPAAISSSVRQRPVEDSTGRYTKYQRFSLLVEFMVFSGCDDAKASLTRLVPGTGAAYTPLFPFGTIAVGADAVDSGAETLRKILSSSGGLLYYKDKGLGTDFIVSGNRTQLPSSYLDVLYGPKPKLTVWEPIGGNKAARIIWEVEVTFADCYTDGDIAEFQYSVGWSIDHCGLTSRNTSGEYEVALLRRNNRMVGANGQALSADSYRDNLKFPSIPGFKRQQSYQLSADRRKLAFSITDTEIDSEEPYYPGICECKVSEKLSSTKEVVNAGRWLVTLSGTIKVANGYPKWYAWLAFVEVMKSRMGCSIKKQKELPYASSEELIQIEEDAKKKGIIWTKLEVTEQIYGREMDFLVSYIMFESGMKNIFKRSCMWQQITPNLTWDKHRASMDRDKGPWSSRGTAQLMHNLEQDLIVSMCGNQDTYHGFFVPPAYGLIPVPSQFNPNNPKDDPPENDTIFDVQVKANLRQESNTVPHHKLRGKTEEEKNEGTGIGHGQSEGQEAWDNMMLQHRSASNYKVDFSGVGIRGGSPFPRVHLEMYGSQKAYLIGEHKFEQKELRTVDGQRIFLARWNATYQLDGSPGSSGIKPTTTNYV